MRPCSCYGPLSPPPASSTPAALSLEALSLSSENVFAKFAPFYKDLSLPHTLAYVSIRQHTHTSAYVSRVWVPRKFSKDTSKKQYLQRAPCNTLDAFLCLYFCLCVLSLSFYLPPFLSLSLSLYTFIYVLCVTVSAKAWRYEVSFSDVC